MPRVLYNKIKKHLESNSKFSHTKENQENLLNELPASLRSQVIHFTHGDII